MGFDIHIVVEENQNDQWVIIKKDGEFLSQYRNYDTFTKLANVRNHYGIEPFVKPRGLPSDSSLKYQSGCHNYTWYELEELITFCQNGKIEIGAYYPGGNGRKIKRPENMECFVRGTNGHATNGVYWEEPFDPVFTDEIKKLREDGKDRRVIIYFN